MMRKYLFISVLYLVGISLFAFYPSFFKVRTNILDALDRQYFDQDFMQVYADYENKLSLEYLALIKSDSDTLYKEFKKSNFFEELKFDVASEMTSIPQFYFQRRAYLLTENQQKKIQNNEFYSLEKKALAKIYSPFSSAGSTFTYDPYLLMDDFFTRLSNPTKLKLVNGKLAVKDSSGEIYYAIRGKIKKGFERQVLNLSEKHKKVNQDSFYYTSLSFYSLKAIDSASAEANFYSVISILIILLFFYLFFKSLRHLLIVLGGIVTCASFGLYLTTFVLGPFHVMALLLGVSILGIMADYFIHYFIKEQEQNLTGKSAFELINKPMLWSLMTTLSGFFIFTFSKVTLLKQFGLFSSITLCLTFVFIKFICPHFFESRRVAPKLRFRFRFSFLKKNVFLISFITILLLISTSFLLKRSNDIRSFATSDKNLKSEEDKIRSLVGLPDHFEFFIVKGNSVQDLLEKEEELKLKLPKVKASFLSNWVPSFKAQEESLKMYKAAASQMKVFLSSLNVNEFSIDDSYHAISLDTFQESFPKHDVHKQLFKVRDHVYSVIPLYTHKNYAKFQNEDIVYVNKIKFINDDLESFTDHIFYGVSLFLALFYLALSFKFNFKNAYFILFPAVISYYLALVSIYLFYGELNLFHFLGGILILSLSLDYSFFYYYHKKGNDIVVKGILLSSLTTLFSFGILFLSSTHAVSSFGLVVFIGISFAFILSPLTSFRSEPNV